MEYTLKKNDITYYYDVKVDEKELTNILEQLKKFSYECFCNGQVAGSITKFPATKNNIYNRIIERNYPRGGNLFKNSIIRHKENKNDYVTYEFSYTKLPDLYDYIDLLINNRNILMETRLFAKKNTNMFYVADHKYQYIIDGLLNYINSYELKDINDYNKSKDNFGNYFFQDFNHIELMKLYKQTLSHIKFELVAKKEILKEHEIQDGYTYVLEKIKNH